MGAGDDRANRACRTALHRYLRGGAVLSYYDQVFYTNAGNQSNTGYYAVPLRPQNTAVVAGQLVRQFTAPAVGSERCFVCIVAGTTANTTDATWVLTRGAKTVDGTATWQECTGIAAVNGDATNTVNWTASKAIGTPSLGAIIQRNSGASYQICTTAGTMAASEPAFSDTAGVTTNDGTSVWTSLGPPANFTKGAAPHARLANVCAANWFAAGNTIYVGDNHAESQATSMTVNPPVTQTAMSRIICHNHAGNYPPGSADLATTATIATTTNQTLLLQISTGSLYLYGLTFSAGSSGNFVNLNLTMTNAFLYCDNCVFKMGTAGTSGCNIQLNAATNNSGFLLWNNCQVSFGAAAQIINLGFVNFVWQNTGQVLASGSTVPTNLLTQFNANYLADVALEALDLSQVVAPFAMTAGAWSIGNWVIKDCKLNASATFPTPLNTGQIIQTIRADGAATAYKSARYAFEGSETTETSITRVGGASDPTGQAQSRKIVTTGNAQWLRPLKAEPYAMWNSKTGANVTVTVCGTVNAAALPNNDDIWLEVEYLGSSGFPQGTIVNTTKPNLFAVNAPVASDGSAWNGGGSGAGWTPFKLTKTLSAPQPGMAGYLHARVRAAKASAIYYIDPQIALS